MLGLFKRKSKKEETCIHSWRLVDFRNVGSVVGYSNYRYELRCMSCSKTSNIDQDTHIEMNRLKLVQ